MKLVSHYVESSLIIVMLVLTSCFVYFQDCRHRLENLRETTDKAAQSLSRELEVWHKSRVEALEQLAALIATTGANSLLDSALVEDTVAMFQTLSPDITSILLANNGQTPNAWPITGEPWVQTVVVHTADGQVSIRATLSPDSIARPYTQGSKGEHIITLRAPEGDAVYRSGSQSPDERTASWTVTAPVDFAGNTYALHITPSRQMLAASAYPVNMIVLVVGIITTLGVAIVLNKELRLRMEQRERHQDHLKQLSALTIESRDQEKHELGRRLHDELGHALSLARMDIESLTRTTIPEPEKIDHAAAQIGMAVDVVRSLSASLSLPGFFDLGFIAPLRHLVDEFRTTTEIHATFEEKGGGPDPSFQRQVCLYRIVQEALTNVLRHAQASQVSVTVQKRRNRISCIIQDDGKGFAPETRERQIRGIGLMGMSQRAEQAGGCLKVSSKPGQGTRITGSFPVST